MRDVRSVLIVDPCAEDRELYCRYLLDDRQNRYEVMQANSSIEALAHCARSLPDVVLLCSALPDMTGLEFLQQFLQQLQQQFAQPLQSHSQQQPQQQPQQNLQFSSQSYSQPHLSRSIPIVFLFDPKQSEATEPGLIHSPIAVVDQTVAEAAPNAVPINFQISVNSQIYCLLSCLEKSQITAESLRSVLGQAGNRSIYPSANSSAENPPDDDSLDPALEALRQENQRLQRQMAEQTAILQQISQQLQQERADRQRAEALLSRSEAEFRVLSEAAPIGIFRIDRQGNCIYVNPRAQAICGYTLEEALGGGWQRSIHPDEREKQWSKWVAAMLANREYADEIRYVHKDGTVRFGRVRTAPIVSAGEIIGHVGTIEDITEAQEMEQIKREFLSIVSHELRTPLASIRGALALLSTGLFDDEPETGQEVLEIAMSDTERLVRLVNDLLDLERLESRQIKLIRQQCDAAALMQQSIDSLQPLAEKEQILLTFTPLSQPIHADPDRIMQILVNLLGNAIKFSAVGQEVHLSAALVTIGGERMIRFQVKDHGPGIPSDKLNLIFERFQQVRPTDNRQQDGAGLGLAICRSLVQLHGGQIWVESQVGSGSTFYFTLPVSL